MRQAEGVEFGGRQRFADAVEGGDHDCEWLMGALFDFAEALDGGGGGGVAEKLPAADALECKDSVLSEAISSKLNELFAGVQ